MNTKIYLILIFVLIAASLSAQKNLVVYHVAGDVNVISGNNTSTAKRGDVLIKNTSLQIKQGSSCMFIEENGKSLQITAAGNYTFEMLQKMMLNTRKEGVTQKFFSYVYENLFSGKHGDKLSVTPVVFRGEELMRTPPDNTIIISDAFTLGWNKPAGKIPVHITISNNSDERIIDPILKSTTSLQFDITKKGFQPGTIYKWKAEELGTRQPKDILFNFLIPKVSDRKHILNDLKLLQDKNLSPELKRQMQQDIFLKWKQFYLQGT